MADSFKDKLAANIVGYVITAIIGATLTMVVRSGGTDARLAAIQQQVESNTSAIKDIQKSLAEGGPAPLAQRVNDLAAQIQNFGTKIDKMYEIVVTLRK